MGFVNGSKATGGKHYSQSTGLKNYVKERDNNTCQVCGQPSQEVDHIIPWLVSHDSLLSNLRGICVKCNRATRLPRRDARLPLNEWYNQIEAELVSASH